MSASSRGSRDGGPDRAARAARRAGAALQSFYPAGSALQRAVASWRNERFRTFAWKLASELGYRRMVRLERPLDEPIAEFAPDLPVTFEVLGIDRIDDYLAARPDQRRDEIERLLSGGRRCFVVRHEGRIVSSCWAATSASRSLYLGRDIVLADGDVYFNDAWTDPAFRGHALAYALCLEQLRYFRDLGFRRAVRGTIPENYSALRTHAKSGFRPAAMLARLRIGPWQRTLDRPWRER